MKIKKTIIIVVILYLLVVLIFKPGFYPTNCTCGWKFEIIRSDMDCEQYCEGYEEITKEQKVVNVLLLNFKSN